MRTEELRGDDQFLCETCDGKRDAARRICLEVLPPVLTLQLLRFVYDVTTYTKKKVSTAIDFPEYLDMTPYVSNGGEGAATYVETAGLQRISARFNDGGGHFSP